ncbi:hypothetical protein HLH12_09300 [Acinetobacter sp. NIPH 2377]|uniref:hypothetical protein n=1 Tax=Acinetobacter terrestris TaxID=2529843 RepID=UPI00148FCC42|nr:hypothetical protein [Acinetobacter terrestris]NNH35739.1 hypothetical protein [Acinetobacter terrestris]
MNTVEQWLAAGNKPKVLPMGFTHFKDGIVPQSAVKPILNEQDRIDREKAIEAKNEEIRKHKTAVREQKKQATRQRYDAQIKDQVAVMSKFESKMQNKDDFKRLADMVGYQFRHLRNAARGHIRLGAEKWEQIKKLVATFEYSEKRAVKVGEKPKQKVSSVPEDERLRLRRVAEAKNEALKSGKMEFIAECKKCGPTKFVFQVGGSAICSKCRSERVKRLKQEKMTKDEVNALERKRERFAHNSELAKQTRLQGALYFDGLCEKCGLTEFRVVGKGRKYQCVHCSKASAQKYKKRDQEGITA